MVKILCSTRECSLFFIVEELVNYLKTLISTEFEAN